MTKYQYLYQKYKNRYQELSRQNNLDVSLSGGTIQWYQNANQGRIYFRSNRPTQAAIDEVILGDEGERIYQQQLPTRPEGRILNQLFEQLLNSHQGHETFNQRADRIRNYFRWEGVPPRLRALTRLWDNQNIVPDIITPDASTLLTPGPGSGPVHLTDLYTTLPSDRKRACMRNMIDAVIFRITSDYYHICRNGHRYVRLTQPRLNQLANATRNQNPPRWDLIPRNQEGHYLTKPGGGDLRHLIYTRNLMNGVLTCYRTDDALDSEELAGEIEWKVNPYSRIFAEMDEFVGDWRFVSFLRRFIDAYQQCINNPIPQRHIVNHISTVQQLGRATIVRDQVFPANAGPLIQAMDDWHLRRHSRVGVECVTAAVV